MDLRRFLETIETVKLKLVEKASLKDFDYNQNNLHLRTILVQL